MASRLRVHLRRHVIAYLALFIALSGTAVALPGRNSVDSGDIRSHAIKPRHLAPSTVRRLASFNFGHVVVGAGALGGGFASPTGLTETPSHDSARAGVAVVPESFELRDFTAWKTAIPPSDPGGDDAWTVRVVRFPDASTGVACTLSTFSGSTCSAPGTARFARGDGFQMRIDVAGSPSAEAHIGFGWRAVPR